MTATELVNTVRRQYLDDIVLPYLWTDDEIIDYINQSQDWLCEEALVIQDSSTTVDSSNNEVCVYSINGTVTPVSEIDLNEKVIAIKKARIVTKAVNLILDSTVEQLDETRGDWEELTAGTPDSLIYKFYDTGKALFVPSWAINDTLKLTIYRYPLVYADLNYQPARDTLEIPVKYHRKMINKILSLAYSKQDVETEDLVKAQKHEQASIQDLNWVKRDLIRFNNTDLVASPLAGNL